MSRLTRDGTAEPVSRDQILRRERGQGKTRFPCSADHEQDWVHVLSAHFQQRVYINRVWLPILLVVNRTGQMLFFPPRPRSRVRSLARQVRPSRPALARSFLVLTDGFLPLSATAFIYYYYYYRQTPSGQSRVHRATQLRTDGVHCRESVGTGTVVLKVVK